MDKLKVWFVVIIAICLVILILSLVNFMSTEVVWNNKTAQGAVPWADWTAYVKLLAPLIASITLLWQGFAGNILSTVKPSVKLIGFGVLGVTIGFGFEVFERVFRGNDPSALNAGTPFFILGAILIVWALFDFPKKLGARLKDSQRPWFLGSVALALIITVVVMAIPSDKSPGFIEIISQILYAILTLAIFAGALRCTMVFAEGRIGRPFRLISIGGLAMFAYVYYVWFPFRGMIDAFHPIHTLWVFCFLIVALGATDLTLKED